MLWLQAFHVVFVVTWFAGLLYLPRLFVYASEPSAAAAAEVLRVMQRRLLAITHIGGGLALASGVSLLVLRTDLLAAGWMHAKLALVAGLIGYHAWCARLVAAFAAGANRRGPTWYRWFNEVPALFLIAIVVLAVVKPF